MNQLLSLSLSSTAMRSSKLAALSRTRLSFCVSSYSTVIVRRLPKMVQGYSRYFEGNVATIPGGRTFFPFFKPERTDAVSQETWIRVSTNLTTAKVGSLSPVKWQEGLEAFEYWTKQRTKLGLTLSWRLLDRLVDEEAFAMRNRPADELFLTQRHLGMVVGNWSKSANLLRARTVLDRLDHYHTILPHFHPNVRILAALLHGAINKRDPNILDLVENVLDRLEKSATAEKHPLSDPDTIAIEPAIEATTRRGYFQNPERANAILERLKKLSTLADISPDEMQNRIMSHLAKSAQPGVAVKVEGMLKDLTTPTTAGYIAVLQAWARSDEQGAADRCYAILNHMKSQERIKANARCYTPVICAFGREKRPHEAEAVLQDLLRQYEQNHDPELLPSVIPFNALIHAWSISGSNDAGIRAETLLQRMSDLAEKTNNPSLKPDKVSFTSVIWAWAHSNHEAGAERAEQIFNRMEELYKQGHVNLKPDAVSYAVTMEAWLASGSKDAVTRTQSLFNKLVTQYEAGDFEMAPNLRTYTVLLETLSRYMAPPERLEAVIREMHSRAASGNPSVMPTTPNYKCALEAWAMSSKSEAPERMESLIKDLHNTERKADRSMYSLVLQTWAKSRLPQAASRADAILEFMDRKAQAGEETVEPTIRCYNFVLKAWANSRSYDAPRRAMAIMNEIRKRRRAGNEYLVPSTMTFNYAISCCKAQNPMYAEELLEEMISEFKQGSQESKPDAASYNHVISAWSRSNHKDRVSRAANVFNRMEYDGDGIGVRPNTNSLSLMIYTCFRARGTETVAVEMAKGYLERMLKLNEVDNSFKPPIVCFDQVIVSLLQSGQPHTNEYAMNLIDLMRRMGKVGDLQGRRDSLHFSFLLVALAQSNVSSKMDHIHAVLKEAASCGVRDLSTAALHYVLEACAERDAGRFDKRILLIKDILSMVATFRDSTFVLVFKALANMRGHEVEVRRFHSICVQHGYQDSEEVLKAYKDALVNNQMRCISMSTVPN